jgi:predicted secreted protein
MSAFTGTAMYIIIWWVALLAVLPVFSRPVSEPDPASGWRGVPRPLRLAKVLLTTSLVAGLVWLAAELVISSPWISFRSGPWSMPSN